MYYIILGKFWWKFAKRRGYLKGNGKQGIKYIRSRKLGFWWKRRENIKGLLKNA